MSNFSPGDHVRWFANQRGWPLGSFNIVTEGETDVRYFKLAARLYHAETGFDLFSNGLSIFCPGIGNEGGTHGIGKMFPILFGLINSDLCPRGKPIFRAIVLLDSDSEGKNLYSGLTGKYGDMVKNRDVFLLRRFWFRGTRDPISLERQHEVLNSECRRLDCEIEDLVSRDLIDCFVSEEPNCSPKFLVEESGFHHCKFPAHAKARLIRFVEDFATLKDIVNIVETLKALRYYMGLESG